MPDTFPAPGAQPSDVALPRPVIPGHELLRRIGHGSYGEVWLARGQGGRFHAVKVVYRKTFDQERPFEREFSGIQKFQPVSRTHSSQVAIQDLGRDQDAGYFYYVMEIADDEVSGQQINPFAYVPKTIKSELRKKGRLSYAECLDIGLCLTTALEHLHKHGLIHRDIKPSNIIYVDGVPKLADIGLVTDVGATISYVGTEGFLPPEGPVSQQADIYSLGKVLYEAATGRDRLDFPELPTFLGGQREKEDLLELNLVFLRACQNDTHKRYQTAHEMHADLALLQSGKSLRRARALEQRLRTFTRLGAVAAAIALLGTGTYYWMSQQRLQESERKRQMEERDKVIAQQEAEKTLGRLVNSYLATGNQLLNQGDVPGALLWFAEAATADHPDLTNQAPHRARMLQTLHRSPKIWAVFPHRRPVTCVSFSDDGRRILTASEDRTAQVWDTQTGATLGTAMEHPADLTWADLSHDGQRLVTSCSDGQVRVARAGTNNPGPLVLNPGDPARQVFFSPDGRLILTRDASNSAKVWNTSGLLQRFALTHDAPVLEAIFSADSRLIATASRDQTARLWRADNGTPVSGPLRHSRPVSHLAFSPDGRRLATVSQGEVRVWNVTTGEASTWTLRHEGDVRSVAFSPDGSCLLTAGEDRAAHLWDAVTGQPKMSPLPHENSVSAAAFSPDGRLVATASGPRLHLWNAATGKPAAPPLTHNGRVTQLCFSPDSSRILTACTDGAARLIGLAPGWSLANAPETATSWQTAQGPNQLGATNTLEATGLRALAQFLSARRIDASGQTQPVDAEALRVLWQEVRDRWPGEFRPPSAAAWHQQQAEAAEQDRLWFAAVFHWDRAFTAEPKQEALRNRRVQAAKELAKLEAAASQSTDLARQIPPRPANARPHLIDLTGHYNAALTETWLPSRAIKTGNDLSALPQGVQKFNGVEFDVRGLIQLTGGGLEDLGGKFPREITGIKIGRKCRRLHFLFGAVLDTKVRTQIGGYRIHLANGETRESRLIYGDNVREWWSSPPRLQLTGAALAWEGSNPASRELGLVLRLYQMIWANPTPEVDVVSLDFFSSLEKPAPFLIAITAE